MGTERKISFARVGGLSSVKYKTREGSRFERGGFHGPPVRNGIFAFTWPYIEPFLVGWKMREGERMKLRKFEYEGPIYAHIKPRGLHRSPIGSWYLMETSDLPIALGEMRHASRKLLQEQSQMYRPDGKDKSQPFLGDPLQFFTKDDLEVFIPAQNLGRIRLANCPRDETSNSSRMGSMIDLSPTEKEQLGKAKRTTQWQKVGVFLSKRRHMEEAARVFGGMELEEQSSAGSTPDCLYAGRDAEFTAAAEDCSLARIDAKLCRASTLQDDSFRALCQNQALGRAEYLQKRVV